MSRLLRAGAYIVLVMPALAVLKGSFQSEGRMVPVAVSGVGEQAFRVTVILAGTWIAVRAGASLYTAGEVAMWGAVVGEAAGVVILSAVFPEYVQRTTGEGGYMASCERIDGCQFQCQRKLTHSSAVSAC